MQSAALDSGMPTQKGTHGSPHRQTCHVHAYLRHTVSRTHMLKCLILCLGFVYIYIHNINTRTYIHASIYPYIHTYIHTYIRTRIRTRIHSDLHMLTCVWKCVCVCICTYVYTYACIHAYTYIYIHTSTYMYICVEMQKQNLRMCRHPDVLIDPSRSQTKARGHGSGPRGTGWRDRGHGELAGDLEARTSTNPVPMPIQERPNMSRLLTSH